MSLTKASWPEIEEKQHSRFGGGMPQKQDAEFFLKKTLFTRMKELLSELSAPEAVWDLLSTYLPTILEEISDGVSVKEVMKWVEQVLDHILPYIDFPGPLDPFVRRIIKNASMKIAEEIARKVLKA